MKFFAWGIGGAVAVGGIGLALAAGAEAIHTGWVASTAHSISSEDKIEFTHRRFSPIRTLKEFVKKIFSWREQKRTQQTGLPVREY